MASGEKKQAEIVASHASGAVAQGIVTDLIKEQTGKHHVYSARQLRHMNKKAQAEANGGSLDDEQSRSGRLIDALNAKVDEGKIRFVTLMHTVTETSLLSVSKAQRVTECEKKKLKATLENLGIDGKDLPESELNKLKKLTDRELVAATGDLAQAQNDLHMSYTCCKPLDPGGEQAEAQELPFTLERIQEKVALGRALMAVREKLTVGDEIMIGSAWAREDECLMFEQFPEVFMFDVTFGTNDEQRPFGVGVAMDGDMKSFTPLRVFMPSQCGWVFNWIFGNAMPALFGADVLDRIQLFLTDGDRTMYGAFQNNQETLYRHARHGLCMYHLVVQGINALKGQMKGWGTENVRNQVETFKQFLFSWMRVGEVETPEEFAESKRCLETWLARQKEHHPSEAVRHNVGLLSDFLTKKILVHKDKWLAHLCQDLLTLHQRTTSAVEGVNSTIKKKAGRTVRPNMGMAESFAVQMKQWDAKMDQLRKEVWREHSSFKAYVSGSPTADTVWKRCESEIQKNARVRNGYHVRLLGWDDDGGAIELLQRRDDNDTPIFCYECSQTATCGPCSEMSPIPRFRRIRTLTFTLLECGSYHVTCSCPYYATCGIACRHFSVFIQVMPHHCIIRHWVRYQALCGTERGTKDLDEWFKLKQRDYRLKITKTEYKKIMEIASAMTDEEEQFLFESPKSMMFQRNKDGMLAFTRAPTGNTMADDAVLMTRDAYAAVEMSQRRKLPDGAVTPSPTRTTAAMTPLLNGAQNGTGNVISLFQTVEVLYKDMPVYLNRITASLVQCLQRAVAHGTSAYRRKQLEQRKAQAMEANAAMEVEAAKGSPSEGERVGRKRGVVDMLPATDRSHTSTRFKAAWEQPAKKPKRQSRNVKLSLHSQSN